VPKWRVFGPTWIPPTATALRSAARPCGNSTGIIFLFIERMVVVVRLARVVLCYVFADVFDCKLCMSVSIHTLIFTYFFLLIFIISSFNNSRTADVWAAEVIAQWQAQQQVAIDTGTLNKVILYWFMFFVGGCV